MDDPCHECTECLGPISAAVQAQNGASLCPQCAEQFYRPCAGCSGLIAQDEAVRRDDGLWCAPCLVTTASENGAALSGEALAALVAEFIRLHAEVKQLNERLDAVKEQLKRHAACQPRVANAVRLQAGEHAVKCGYSVRVSYNADQLAAVEAMLGTESFKAFFTRKTTFSPVKESLEAFLASEASDTAAARAAILAAAERTEIATVTPVAPKRQTSASGGTGGTPGARP